MSRQNTRILSRVLKEMKARRYHLLSLCLSGSHLYGFPSPDSDLDYRGVFAFDTESILGLRKLRDVIEVTEGSSDIVLFELGKVIGLAIKGNGNVLEHLVASQVYSTAEHAQLKMFFRVLPKRGIYNHYRGLALGNYNKFILTKKKPSAKMYLYVIGALMRGIHALRTGKIEPNVLKLNEYFMVDEVTQLVDYKRTMSDKVLLSQSISSEMLDKVIKSLFVEIDEAYAESTLPEELPQETIMKVDSFLKKTRRKFL